MLSNYQCSVPGREILTGKFCLPAPVVLSGTFDSVPYTLSVTSIAPDGDNPNLAIVTLAAPFTFSPKAKVTISGANESEYNGTFSINVIDQTSFSYWFAGSGGAATGTIIVDLGLTKVTGTGTKATTELQVGDWLYIPSKGVVRRIQQILTDTVFLLTGSLPSNASDELVRVADFGVYNALAFKNAGSSSGSLAGKTFAKDDTASYMDPNGLTPICGDGTGTSIEVVYQKRFY